MVLLFVSNLWGFFHNQTLNVSEIERKNSLPKVHLKHSPVSFLSSLAWYRALGVDLSQSDVTGQRCSSLGVLGLLTCAVAMSE